MTPGHVYDELYQLLRGDLSNPEMLAVNDHLRDCEACRSELVDASLAHALLTSVSDLLAPEFSASRRSRDADRLGEDLPPLDFLESSSGGVGAGWGLEPDSGDVGPSPVDASLNPVGSRPTLSFERTYRADRPKLVGGRPGACLPLAPGSGPLATDIGPLAPAPEPLATDTWPLAPAPEPLATDTGPDRARIGALNARSHRRRPASGARRRRVERAGRAMYRLALVAVAVVVLVFAAIFGVGSLQRPRASNSQILLTAALEPLPADPNATGSVTVWADGDVTIATSGLLPAPSGHYYEVWLVDPGRSGMLPLGILAAGGAGTFSFPPNLWSRYAGVEISLQATGMSASTGVNMLSSLAPAPHRASSRPKAHPRTHHPSKHHPRPRHPRIGHRSSSSGSGDGQPPRAVKSLLGSSERQLPSGLVLLVDTTADSHAVHPGSGLCRDLLGRCSLRAAVEVADALRTPITIRMLAGMYDLDLGPLVASDPAGVSIIGVSAAATVIVQGQATRVLVVREADASVSAGGSVVSLVDLTVRGGTAPSIGAWGNDGGGILVADGADLLELSQVTIADGRAALAGGGLFTTGQVWATGATFENDSAGISGGAAQFERTMAVVTSSMFNDDVAGWSAVQGAEGGAVDDDAGALVLVYSSFVDDSVAVTRSAARGGAVDLRGPAWLDSDTFVHDDVSPAPTTAGPVTEAGGGLYVGSGPVTIADATFERDGAEGDRPLGGAVFNAAGLTVTSSRFVGNEVSVSPPEVGGEGAAIYDSGDLTVTGSRFSRNTASNDGGAIYDGGQTTIADSVFSGNRALGGGGAIYDDASLTLRGSTLSRGVALFGAGMFVEGSLLASGDAVADNVAAGAGAAGGGILIVGRVNSMRPRFVAVRRSTIVGNVAPGGAGIAEQAGTGLAVVGTISRSVVSGNDLPSGVEQDCAAIGPGGDLFLASGGGNVVGDKTCDLASPTDRQGPSAIGYWLAAADGAVRACASVSYGSFDGATPADPVVAMAAVPGNDGYWEVTADGGVDNFGSASWFGSAKGLLGDSRVTGFAATLDGGGYWLVASDGNVFSFGDAENYGSATGEHIVAIARSVDGRGYWLLAADGDVRAFGDAPRIGSRTRLVAAAIAATADGQGYWVAAANGKVYAFGDATGYGGTSTSGIVALLPSPDGRGYLLVNDRGRVFAHGDASSSSPATLIPVAAAAT